MILNTLGTIALLLAAWASQPRDWTDVFVSAASITLILAAIWI